MVWPLKKRAEPTGAPGPVIVKPAQTAPAPPADGKERMTANDWAKKHGLNEVQAERAAMRAGRWHDLFTEEEFLDLLRNARV